MQIDRHETGTPALVATSGAAPSDRVGDVMTEDAWVCRPQETLEHAARLLWERDCGALPVVDRDERVVGMITDRDVCMAAYTKGKPLSRIHVGDVMSSHVHFLRPADTVAHAENWMSQFQVRRLPVLDESGHLLGILSLVDLARRLCEGDQEAAVAAEAGATLRTLAAIGRPRGTARTPSSRRA